MASLIYRYKYDNYIIIQISEQKSEALKLLLMIGMFLLSTKAFNRVLSGRVFLNLSKCNIQRSFFFCGI